MSSIQIIYNKKGNVIMVNSIDTLKYYFSFKSIWPYIINKDNSKKLVEFLNEHVRTLSVHELSELLDPSYKIKDKEAIDSFFKKNGAYKQNILNKLGNDLDNNQLKLLGIFILIHEILDQEFNDNELDKSDDLDIFRIDDGLNKKSAVDFIIDKIKELKANIILTAKEDFILNKYNPLDDRGSDMEFVRLENKNDSVCKVKIRDTCLCCSVHPGSYVYALRKGKGYLSFYKKMDFSGDYLVKCSDVNHFYQQDIESGININLKDRIKINGNEIVDVCFYRNDRIANTVILSNKAEIQSLEGVNDYSVNKNVVMISTYKNYYAILLNNGEVISDNENINNNKNIVYVNVGYNGSSAIIDSYNKCTVYGPDNKSNVLEDVATVKTFEERYIALHLNGDVSCDGESELCENCSAIGITKDHYIALVNNGNNLYIYDKEKKCESKINIDEMDFYGHVNDIICDYSEIFIANDRTWRKVNL